ELLEALRVGTAGNHRQEHLSAASAVGDGASLGRASRERERPEGACGAPPGLDLCRHFSLPLATCRTGKDSLVQGRLRKGCWRSPLWSLTSSKTWLNRWCTYCRPSLLLCATPAGPRAAKSAWVNRPCWPLRGSRAFSWPMAAASTVTAHSSSA